MVVMSDPRTWAIPDVLPVSRVIPGELWPELGVVIPGRCAVFVTSAFEPGLWKRLGTCQREEYPNFEEMQKAGWQVN